MDQPKISVVLCSYNGEKFISQQIESILKQSILPDELVISDDGSTDATVDILLDLARTYPEKVRFCQNRRPLGFIKNFEKVIALAKGEVIFLSDQDDLWFENKIEEMLKPFIKREDIGLVYSDAIITDSALCPTKHTLFERRKKIMLDTVRSAPLLIKEVGINGCTMAFRSSIKEFVLPIGEKWGHDHWIAFIAHAVGAVAPVREPLMYYRRHQKSAGNDPQLEGGSLKVWTTALHSISIANYEGDLKRWESMLKRLRDIKKKQSATRGEYTSLDLFLRECERRTDLALRRKRMKEKGRFNRLFDVLSIFLSGCYHQYLHGMKSMAKDLFCR